MSDSTNNQRPAYQFQPGNKVAKGGARPGAGRRPKNAKTAAEILREMLTANVQPVGNRYLQRALGKNGDRVLCHVIDKLLPDDAQAQLANNIQIAILTAGSKADESDVWASGLQIRIDSSNGKDPDGSNGA